ncbi:MAG TPA: teicoplanin resistance protein VanZ [Gallionella sp.]|nr:MAG: teicoplanin resistance protein VanZ [Gallionellales bacterium GWA2_54_124]HCI53910.1 teicoplanin resistance protein VanZ [Gallionella sp.]
MSELFISESRARLRTLLAAGYALFIAYVSLSPFTGWRDQGLRFNDVLSIPLLSTFTPFDAVVNVLAYIPFGFLVGLALRARFAVAVSLLVALSCGIGLSASMEFLQMYLPSRTSSNLDVLTNSSGTLIGTLLAVNVASWSWFRLGLMRWRSSQFHHGREMDFGLALLALWVFGQINPSLPMLGNVFITEAVHQPFAAPLPEPFSWWETGVVTLNLLMLGALLLSLLRAPRRVASSLLVVLSMVALIKFIAAAVLLKSWALLLWINGEAMLGILLGLAILILLLWIPRATVNAAGALVALSYFVMVNFIVDGNTPAAAMSVYHWHYGHLLNYNGLAQTITLIFPVLLLFHLWRIRNV